jgi:hypothetical protein
MVVVGSKNTMRVAAVAGVVVLLNEDKGRKVYVRNPSSTLWNLQIK